MTFAPRQRPPRRDDNERAVIDALRKAGVLVYQGLPVDLLCYYRGRLFCLEVKDGAKPPSARRLTQIEQDFCELTQTKVVLGVEDALLAALTP